MVISYAEIWIKVFNMLVFIYNAVFDWPICLTFQNLAQNSKPNSDYRCLALPANSGKLKDLFGVCDLRAHAHL